MRQCHPAHHLCGRIRRVPAGGLLAGERTRMLRGARRPGFIDHARWSIRHGNRGFPGDLRIGLAIAIRLGIGLPWRSFRLMVVRGAVTGERDQGIDYVNQLGGGPGHHIGLRTDARAHLPSGGLAILVLVSASDPANCVARGTPWRSTATCQDGRTVATRRSCWAENLMAPARRLRRQQNPWRWIPRRPSGVCRAVVETFVR